ncbi:MAG: NRDE family protein [Polaromonas sp.]|uniref:NRDE family protein n=1 Tax=Polaromonas sp. TaxID=1869339 RepID=UPI0025FEFCA3|nr:NRDE family protein [Polaromonas sp.]MBI2725159.1 NRDE family protein [Polaromonas sp.]
MCLVAFAINASARWPLVIASNRDESFERPTLPLQRWESPSGQAIISGRDMHAGGAWMGATPEGRAAFLTNVREHPLARHPAPRSRGELVTRWLDGGQTAMDFMGAVDPAEYGGFNLVVCDWREKAWTWLGNRPQDNNHNGSSRASWVYRHLTDGIYGLSNAALDTPWPKTLALKAALDNALGDAESEESSARLENQLWQALASRQQAVPGSLPGTGVPVAWEKALSSAFVYAPERAYGTRCSTLLIAERDAGTSKGKEGMSLKIQEKTFPPGYEPNLHDQAKISVSITSQTLSWAG